MKFLSAHNTAPLLYCELDGWSIDVGNEQADIRAQAQVADSACALSQLAAVYDSATLGTPSYVTRVGEGLSCAMRAEQIMC